MFSRLKCDCEVDILKIGPLGVTSWRPANMLPKENRQCLRSFFSVCQPTSSQWATGRRFSCSFLYNISDFFWSSSFSNFSWNFAYDHLCLFVSQQPGKSESSLCNKCSKVKLVPKYLLGSWGSVLIQLAALLQLWAESSYLDGSSVLVMFRRDFLTRAKHLLYQTVMQLKICVFVMVLVWVQIRFSVMQTPRNLKLLQFSFLHFPAVNAEGCGLYLLLGFVDVELEAVVLAWGCQSSDLLLLTVRPKTVVISKFC